MLTSATKRFILPFSNQKQNLPETEAAAVFAVADFERSKRGGFLNKQLEEKLVFISMIFYPIWLFPENTMGFVFDGFGDSSYRVSYVELPPVKQFIESFEANSIPIENYAAFLSDHTNYFQQSIKEKQYVFRGLIADLDFKNEFNVYRKEATEIISQPGAILSLTLEETTIYSMLSEFDKLRLSFREEDEKLLEYTRRINKTTKQYLTELDYETAAAKEEADAKIKAQEELVNPQVAKLNKEYNRKIKDLTESFYEEMESLKKSRTKTLKSIEICELKIKSYEREAKAQAIKKHAIYEKRWKEKIKQTKKDLKSLRKEIKNIERPLKKISKQKTQGIYELDVELDAEIKLVRQPLQQLEVTLKDKILFFKQETEKLLKKEKPVLESLSKSIKLREDNKAMFEGLGIQSVDLKGPALFYVPFYVAGYETGLTRRYYMLPPSTIAALDFSAKLKGAFGLSKIRELFVPRYKSISSLISNVQVLTRQNSMFESQMYNLCYRNNLLNNSLFMENVQKGLVYLNHLGRLSDKDQKVLSNRSTA